MRIIFDQGVPVPLRRFLSEHVVETAFERGWSTLSNGDLISAAEAAFDLFVTTDQSLRYQLNLIGRRLAILVLPTTRWPEIQRLKGTSRRLLMRSMRCRRAGSQN